MLGKLRSNISHRRKKSAERPSNFLSGVEENVAVDSRSNCAREEGTFPVATLPAQGPSAEGPSFTANDANALKLHIIHEPKSKPIADVIFVHGLGGHCYKTWSKDRNINFFWPGLWLPKDPKLQKTRLSTFGYGSWLLGPKNISNIMSFAKSLLFEMRYTRGNQGNNLRIGDAPIIFVAHSMGGLVVKKACLMAKDDPNCAHIAPSILGIVFLSTPHRGSNLSIALDIVLRAAFQSKRSFVEELERNSSAIEEINDQFRHVAPKLSIISFYEEQPTRLFGKSLMIVRRDSAILGYNNEDSRGLAANHHTICKFATEQDPNYRIVRDTLKSLVEKFESSTLRTPGAGAPNTGKDIRKVLGLSHTPAEDLKTLRKRWVAGSCEWFLRYPGTQLWLTDRSNSHLIWYNAPPANGKSTLSRYLIHYLQSQGYHCQYYFFSSGDQSRQLISGMLKSLAHQIASVMPDYGEEIFTTCAEGFRLDEEDYHFLWQKLFQDLLIYKTFPRPLFWVIDGLDESELPQMVVELLGEFLEQTRIQIKVLVTSRRTEALARKIKRVERLLKVNIIDGEAQNHNNEDIKLLVDEELEDLDGTTAMRDRLRQEILKRAQGNFLWVKIVLEELHKCQTESEIQAILEQIPENMTKMYSRMLLAITENPNEKRARLAKELLQWVTFVPQPLTLDELRDAVSKDYPDVIDLKKTVRDICGQFIVVDSTSHVTITHETARDFLINAPDSMNEINRHNANSTILRKSLSSLGNPSTRALAIGARGSVLIRQKLESQYPFTIYAANSWFYYLGYADSVSEEGLEALETFFRGPHVLDWIYILAVLDQITTLAKAGSALLRFVASKDKRQNSIPHRLRTLELVRNWGIDLVRIAAKFKKHLMKQPYAIYEVIPALSPSASTISRQFHQRQHSKITVSGQNESWTDVFARYSLSQAETVLKIVSSGPHLAVYTRSGIAHVWSSVDFGELCAVHHGEPVIDMCMNHRGDLLVTYGLKTTIVWDIPAGIVRLQVPNAGNRRAVSLTFAKNDQRVLAATDDRSVRFLEIAEDGAVWKVLDASLLKETPESDLAIINSPSCIVFNATGTQVGVCYRSFPLTVWDLNTARPISRCLRPIARTDSEPIASQTWFPVELFDWNPVTGHIIGWYKANNVFKWHPVTDEIHEVPACIDGLISSPNGKLFVTSDSDGVVKLWNFASFSVIYQISSGDLVSGLSFSPDSTRFYDIRGSTITAWEPSSLTRLVESEEILSDPASEEQHGAIVPHVRQANAPQGPSLTALSAAPGGLWYVTGNNDGKVHLGDVRGRSQIELTRFADFQCVGHLVWSPNGSIVVAADLALDIRIIQIDNISSGHLNPQDIRHLQRPNLALEGESIHQMIIDLSSRLLLVVGDTLAQTWDIVDCSIKNSAPISCAAQQGWFAHPTNHELFLGIGLEDAGIYEWSTLQQIHHFKVSYGAPSLVRQPTSTSTQNETANSPQTDDLPILGQQLVAKINKVMLTQDDKHVLVHAKEFLPGGRVRKRLVVLEVKALDSATSKGKDKGVSLENIDIADNVAECLEMPLGILPGSRLVFLDRDFWVCTTGLKKQRDLESLSRHYFIPRDWTKAEDLVLCTMLRDGTILCIQGGNVVTVRSNFGGIDL